MYREVQILMPTHKFVDGIKKQEKYFAIIKLWTKMTIASVQKCLTCIFFIVNYRFTLIFLYSAKHIFKSQYS